MRSDGSTERWGRSSRQTRALLPEQPWGLIHADIRSDNLALREGRLVLFDWADLRRGPLAFDVAAFLPSLAAEGGLPPAKAATLYRGELRRHGVTLPGWSMAAAASAVAGYFASRAGRPAMQDLPRLREIQRTQLRHALPWAAKELRLPAPPDVP